MISYLEQQMQPDLNPQFPVKLFPTSCIVVDRSKLISSGGFGEVFKVQFGDSQAPLAQKLIQQDLKSCTKQQIVEFFRSVFKEINVMYFITQIDSDRLLKIRGISIDINKSNFAQIAIYSDLMHRDLQAFIKEFAPGHNELAKFKVLKQICEGVQSLQHKDLIHGDLKPRNVLLDKADNALLADFGTLKLQTNTITVASGQELIFTPLYSPPELIKRKEQNKGTDIWSLGCLMLKLFTGVSPYHEIDSKQLI